MRSSSPEWLRDAVAVVAGKALVSALTLATGFRALSDDDYARIVIAQRFAESPSLDPSGTSWLPLPFWLNGAAMLLFGPSVGVARSAALVLGVASVLVVWVAARWLGASRLGALVGALAAGVFPYSAWLGVATVPELPTAALCLLGVASLRRDGAARLVGGIALSAACLSRYESWPVALVFAVFCLRDALDSRARVNGAAALLALSGPALWLGHGVLHHQSALFFVKRVSEYRRAIGAGNQHTWDALSEFPAMLWRSEPELCAATAAVLLTALFLGERALLRRHARALCAFGALLAFLIAGDLRDGAPTHHAERALLTVWLWFAALGGDAFGECWRRATAPVRALLIALPGLAATPMTGIVRPWYARRDAFIDRDAELRAGRTAAAAAGPSGRLLIDSPDFGFYAVMAGFGAPSRSEPVDGHDPRKARTPDPFGSVEALRARLAAGRADWLLVEPRHLEPAAHLGVVEHDSRKYLLLRLERR